MKKLQFLLISSAFFWLVACGVKTDENPNPPQKNLEIPEQYNQTIDEEKRVELGRQRLKELNNIRK